MIVTAKTKYRDFKDIEQVALEESLQELKHAAEAHFKPCSMLTIDEFFGVVAGDYSLLGDLADPSVYQVYWLKRFADFADAFKVECERTQLPQTAEQKQAAQGALELTPQEAMLVFVQEYFSDRSFFDAGTHTIGEYLLARKVKYNEQLAQRNFENIQRNKFKHR